MEKESACVEELIEAHDFKTDVLKVSREGRMGAVGLRDAVEVA